MGRNKKIVVPYEMTQPGTSRIRNDKTGLSLPKTPRRAVPISAGAYSGANNRPVQLNRLLIT